MTFKASHQTVNSAEIGNQLSPDLIEFGDVIPVGELAFDYPSQGHANDMSGSKDDAAIELVADFRLQSDFLDLSDLLDAVDYSGANPFADGIISVEQHGQDAVVMLHGADANPTPTAVAVLQDILADDIDTSHIIIA